MKKFFIICFTLLFLKRFYCGPIIDFFKNLRPQNDTPTAPFPCSTSGLRERSILKGVVFRDLEKCCEDFVKSYESCLIASELDTCLGNFESFADDFCGYLRSAFSKYMCSRLLKSWTVRAMDDVDENYANVQNECLDIQICTKADGNIADDEVCLDSEGYARKKDKLGFLYRVEKLKDSDKFLLQSINSLKCVSNTANEFFMEDCDDSKTNQQFELKDGINSFFSGDFVLMNNGLCLTHSQTKTDVTIFESCDSSFSGSDWVLYDKDGSNISSL